MSISVTIVCIFLAAASLAGLVLTLLYEFYFGYRFAVKERIRNLQVAPSKIPLELLYHKSTKPDDLDQSLNWRTRLETLRLQSDISLSSSKLYALVILSGLCTAFCSYYCLRQWWCILLGFCSGLLLPIGYLE